MKIVYGNNEKEKIDVIYKTSPIILFPDDTPDRLYGITFKVTNPSLAQYILVNLLNTGVKELDLGIELESINLKPIQDTNEIREKLHKMIDKIIDNDV